MSTIKKEPSPEAMKAARECWAKDIYVIARALDAFAEAQKQPLAEIPPSGYAPGTIVFPPAGFDPPVWNTRCQGAITPCLFDDGKCRRCGRFAPGPVKP